MVTITYQIRKLVGTELARDDSARLIPQNQLVRSQSLYFKPAGSRFESSQKPVILLSNPSNSLKII
jgi:hypothetical protein